MVDLDELERLDREATPGPWADGGVPDFDVPIFGADGDRVCEVDGPHYRGGKENAALIVACRNALPDLIAELRRLRELEAAVLTWEKIRRRIHVSDTSEEQRYYAAIAACRAARASAPAVPRSHQPKPPTG